MNNLGDGANYAFFNGITYVRPKVPTLYTALTTQNYTTDARVYGRDTNPFVLRHNHVIEIVVNKKMNNLGDGANYAFFNGITYVRPKVPTLYTALTTQNYTTDARVYGRDTNPFVLRHNHVIEIVVNKK